MKRSYGTITVGRGDLAAMARKAAKEMAANRERARVMAERDAREQSSYPTLTVLQRSIPPHEHDPKRTPRLRWETVNTPHGLPTLTVEGSLSEAVLNGWDHQELMRRRIRRRYLEALEMANVALPVSAFKYARETPVYVADVGLALTDATTHASSIMSTEAKRNG